MYKYLILQNPGHNRVYYNLSEKLALSELQLTCAVMNSEPINMGVETIANVRYLSFETEKPLTAEDLELVSRLSFLFALYQVDEINGELMLKPLQRHNYEYVDEKISTLLKYAGKTNELFTKMMINVGVLSSDFHSSDPLLLLDPVAGKGTTLYEALVYGYSAYGIELESKSVQESVNFFKKYLEAERYKHIFNKQQVSGNSKSEAIYLNSFGFARSKDEFNNEENRKWLGIINGNSTDADHFFRKNTFHLVVGDLPYGIAHGNTAKQKKNSITRNPSEMLTECAPVWYEILQSGGVLVLAWNSFVASPKKLQGILSDVGFYVLTEEPYNGFEHKVDKAIRRDIIVAKKL